ncbi:MAG: winged helix-turn-helix transcriptional regulator [Clostridia bacterium]|nr:winged helix-turn-helix transcriptional regulator [Clostridia bacterium]
MQKKEKITLPKCEHHELHAAAIGRNSLSMPKEREIASLSEFFKILGDPTRLKILFAIHSSPLCVCDIAEMLGMTKSAVSHQLKILRQSSLVSYRKAGKNVFYSPADDHVRIIAEMALEHINE